MHFIAFLLQVKNKLSCNKGGNPYISNIIYHVTNDHELSSLVVPILDIIIRLVT